MRRRRGPGGIAVCVCVHAYMCKCLCTCLQPCMHVCARISMYLLVHVCLRCKHSSADVYQVVIFEQATFLVIAHSTHRSFSDVHRFEKVSNIIKQFKLSCTKSHADFRSMQVFESACFSLSLSLSQI